MSHPHLKPIWQHLRRDSRWRWLAFGLLTLGLQALVRPFPQVVETLYARGLFPVFRLLWDYSLGWLPVAWVYLLALGLLARLGWGLWRSLRGPGRGWRRLGEAVLSLAAWASAIVGLFFWMWGFHYQRVGLEAQTGLRTEAPSREGLQAEWTWALSEAEHLRQEVPSLDSLALRAADLPPGLEAYMRTQLEAVLDSLGYPTAGRVRGRSLYPAGLLMQLGATGIYIPFVAEGHIDAALPPVSRPYTLAHELAHGYGFADEGTCNFLAWLACRRAADPAVRYAGSLSYWREVAVAYRRMVGPEAYKAARETLSPGMQADIETVNAVLRRYPGFFPRFSQATYDTYLKSQGIAEGTLNYSRVIRLVRAWRQSNEVETPSTMP